MTQSEIQQFTPVWPHGEIREIFKNIFFVTGTNKVHYAGDDIQTSRNMIIIRDGTQLTLINTVRLDEVGLQKLDSLGEGMSLTFSELGHFTVAMMHFIKINIQHLFFGI